MCEVTIVSDGVQIKPGDWERTGGVTGDFLVAFGDIVEVSTSDDPTSLVRG